MQSWDREVSLLESAFLYDQLSLFVYLEGPVIIQCPRLDLRFRVIIFTRMLTEEITLIANKIIVGTVGADVM